MNPKVKKLWVDALRSGEYKQTQAHLKNKQGYCCLGVLCDIAVKNEVVKESTIDDDPGYISSRNGIEYVENATLPVEVVEWAAVASSNPEVNYDSRRPSCGDEDCEDCVGQNEYDLSELNDSLNLSFAEIADLIEEQF